MYAPTTGPTLMDTATERSLRVIRGVTAKQSALHLELIFQVSTVKRKMSMFKTCTAENTLGWACLISTLKGRLFGAMEHLLTFITGQSTNRTTFAMKIASTPSGLFVIINTNGTMSIVQTATSFLARKVRLPLPPYFTLSLLIFQRSFQSQEAIHSVAVYRSFCWCI